ncbi:MAG TPA: hypothetical protein VNZ65_13630 [Collimonas sp.]|nr:hypothetical protein [Collimonas sp.]
MAATTCLYAPEVSTVNSAAEAVSGNTIAAAVTLEAIQFFIPPSLFFTIDNNYCL